MLQAEISIINRTMETIRAEAVVWKEGEWTMDLGLSLDCAGAQNSMQVGRCNYRLEGRIW